MSDDGVVAAEVELGLDAEGLGFDPAEVAALAEDLSVGDVLDGIYRLERTLGEGAMGRIFEAQDLDLNRRVAIKVPLVEEAVDVLIAEARALAALRHNNLPVVHAAGRHEGVSFLVMERLRGVDLDEHVAALTAEGRSLPLYDAMQILSHILDALAAIHQAGIAHRDIKPANVLLCKRGPVLIDFGLVAAASSRDAVSGGSPSYVAPEIITDTSERSSRHLADIYSFGVLAYEVLTGEVPFDHDDLRTLLRMHVTAEVPDVRARRPDVPPKLAALIKEMMAKKPGERPSAEEALWAVSAMAKRFEGYELPARPVVVVVSDDLALVGKLTRLFKEWLEPAKVRVCRSGDAAVALLGETAPDLLLLDVQLADMSAMELLLCLSGGESAPRSGGRGSKPGPRVHDPRAVVALTQSSSAEDAALLKRFDIHALVPRDDPQESLAVIVRNVFQAKAGSLPG